MKETDDVKRTINEVLDIETGQYIKAEDFFEQDEEALIRYRYHQEEVIQGYRKPKFVCPFCFQDLKILGKKSSRGEVSYFSHTYDSEDCEIKTTSALSKEEIEASRYNGVKESDRHKRMKEIIFNALDSKESRLLGISNVCLEKTVKGIHPLLNWRKPDVQAVFRDKKVVFEVQLSTTFLSEVVARDIFYRLNQTYIIWIFNLSENQEYFNLESLIVKDIFYANKKNIFVLDDEAIHRTNESSELWLNCIWMEYSNDQGSTGSSELVRKSEYVKYTDLNFDEVEYKPYHIDCDNITDDNGISNSASRKRFESEKIDWIKAFESSLEKKAAQRREKEEKLAQRKLEIREIIRKGVEQGTLNLEPELVKKRWGYKHDDQLLINAKFSSAEMFDDEGYAVVGFNRKLGVIDVYGEEVVPCIYKKILKHKGRKFFVSGNYGWELINLNSGHKTQIDCEHMWLLQDDLDLYVISITDFERVSTGRNRGGWNTYATEKKELKGLVNSNGEVLIAPFYFYISSFQNGVAIASRGKLEGELKYDGATIDSFIYGIEKPNKYGISLAKKSGKIGLINSETSELAPFIYDSIGEFHSGYFKVFTKYHQGILDWQGNVLIPCIYNYIGPFEDGNAKAKQDNFYGVISLTGKTVIPFVFEEMEDFSDSIARVKSLGKWGYIGRNGDTIIPIEFDELEQFRAGTAKARKADKCGYINDRGNEVIRIVFDSIDEFLDGKAIAKKKNTLGAIDANGNEVVPFKFDFIKRIDERFAIASVEGLYGIIDLNNFEEREFVYDLIENFKQVVVSIHPTSSGYRYQKITSKRAKVKKADKCGIIDSEGKEIIEPTCSRIDELGDLWYLAFKDGKYGLFHKNGEVVLDAKYDQIEYLNPGYFKVKLGLVWGMVNSTGETVITPKYEHLTDFSSERIKIKHKGKVDYVSNLAKYICRGKRGFVDQKGVEYWQYWQF